MASKATLLCVHRDPFPFSMLREEGYEVLATTDGIASLRMLLMAPTEAVVTEYQLSRWDGCSVSVSMKKLRPNVPIIMVLESLEVPNDILRAVDAVVLKSDGIGLLLATLESLLMPDLRPRAGTRNPRPAETDSPAAQPAPRRLLSDHVNRDGSFPPHVWRGILDGSIRFPTSSRP